MDAPVLVSNRWQLGEFIFLEYRKSAGILVDVGPFPQNPDDEQTEKAYSYLADSHLTFLSLGDAEWALDLIKLSERLPQLQSENLTGQLPHPPAFETTSISFPTVQRFFNTGASGHAPLDGCFFLRVHFVFPDSTEEQTIIPPANDSAEALSNNSSTQIQEVEEPAASEQSTEASGPAEEDVFYLYSKFNPEACRQKFRPYIQRASDSSVIQMPTHPFEFSVTLGENSFLIKKSDCASARHEGYFSATFRADQDGGTYIIGEYGISTRDLMKSILPYIAIMLSVCMGLTGWQWMQNPGVPTSKMLLGGCVLVIGLFSLYGSTSILRKAVKDRKDARIQDRGPLVDFVQKTLETETVAHGEA